MNKPFLTPNNIPKPDPFKVFLAKVAGQRFEYREANTRIVAYMFRGVIYVTECQTIT